MYGPYVTLVLALPTGVRKFVAAGSGKASVRFISNGEIVRLPEHGDVFGVGGLKSKWTPRVKEFVESLESRSLKLRYSGSFTGDVNQIIHYGGFFAYPELTDAPNGKLRLQFDLEPTSVTQRVPTYLGNADLVTEFESLNKS
jgi:fructose-1,6-bisphosphatase I